MRLVYFFQPDEIFTPPPIQDEDVWRNPVPPVASYKPPIVFRYDDVAVPVLPIQDEDLWQNPVAPIQATNFIALPYLFDVEEIPILAGIVPDDVEGVGSVRAVYGSGVATVPKVTGSGRIRTVGGSGKID